MKNYLTLLLILFFAAMHTNLAAMSTTDSSSIRGPSSVSSKVQCTSYSLNGTNIGYYTGISQTFYNVYKTVYDALGIPFTNPWGFKDLSSVFDASNCITVKTTNTGALGAVVILSFVGSGDLGIMCPADHPYYTSFGETWVSVFSNLGVNPGASCCKVPPNRVSNSTAWTTYTPDSTITDGVCNDYTFP